MPEALIEDDPEDHVAFDGRRIGEGSRSVRDALGGLEAIRIVA